MISLTFAASLLGVSTRRLRTLCEAGRVPGATKVGRVWILPDAPVVTKAERTRPGKIDMA